MSETRFTKGPWYIDELEIYSDDCDSHEVAVVSYNHTCRDLYEVEANAHLIAAAPDLYEALSLLLSQVDPWVAGYQEAEQALTKARGEST